MKLPRAHLHLLAGLCFYSSPFQTCGVSCLVSQKGVVDVPFTFTVGSLSLGVGGESALHRVHSKASRFSCCISFIFVGLIFVMTNRNVNILKIRVT